MIFIKRQEDFVCEHCGALVTGSGYTNHCPVCLWSKHVDNDPGDRAATCGGLMRPVRIEGTSPDYTIVHRCEICSIEKRNRAAADDSVAAILDIAAHRSD